MTQRWFARELALAAMTSALLLGIGCARPASTVPAPKATALASALVESSGSKQIAAAGMVLPQPVVVQANDDQGNGVQGALVEMSGPAGVTFDPVNGLTDSSGQFTTSVSLGGMAGRYQIVARTRNKAQKPIEIELQEIALGYQETLGSQLNDKYCERCHNPESTAVRVSNYDNLEVKPHPFTDGNTLNQMSDADLTAIISHGGPALNKSPLMPPYGYTLSKTEIQALIAYIRAVSDPLYKSPGLVYAKNVEARL